MQTLAYGPLADQVGDLYLPTVGRGRVICLLHGGFWRMPWARDTMTPVALDLQQRGFVVWNLEYRRVGGGGGWPATFEDVAAGIDHLAALAETHGFGLRVTVVGHSAGGHLALWSAANRGRVRVTLAVGLAPVADLAHAHALHAGHGAVQALMGGSPLERPERYRAASPAERLPLGVRQVLIHGTEDADVPVVISRHYARAARAAGDAVDYLELPTAGHMDFVDPTSTAHAALCRTLTE